MDVPAGSNLIEDMSDGSPSGSGQMARVRFGLPPHERADATAERAVAMTAVTAEEVSTFLQLCIERHDRKRIDPGTLPHCLHTCLKASQCFMTKKLPLEASTRAEQSL